jgi:hypothetical protein
MTVGYKKTILPNNFGYITHRSKITKNRRNEITAIWNKQIGEQFKLGLYWFEWFVPEENNPNKLTVNELLSLSTSSHNIFQSRKRS